MAEESPARPDWDQLYETAQAQEGLFSSHQVNAPGIQLNSWGTISSEAEFRGSRVGSIGSFIFPRESMKTWFALVSGPEAVKTMDMARQDNALPFAELRKRWERGLSKMPKVTSQQAYEQARQAALEIVTQTSGERSGKSRRSVDA